MTHVVVVGGGISGLTAAYRLRTLLPAPARITVVEQAVVGGKLRTIGLGGLAYDVGAETFLVRRPEAVRLVTELGLAGRLVHPTPVTPGLRIAGRTAALPAGTVLGVPADPDALAGVLSAGGLARARAERDRPLAWAGGDVAVGGIVTERFGAEVTERLVDPLLGGVYAGSADRLGLRATMPGLAAELDAAARAGRPVSLTGAAAAVLRDGSGGPVFGALAGGMCVLVDALRDRAGAEFRVGLPVRALHRASGGWRVEIGAAPSPEFLHADAVLLAVPPPALRRLLAPLSPAAGTAAAGIDVASMAVVALAFPPQIVLPAMSGVLAGAAEPLHAKAVTYSSRKWAHLAGGPVLVRASVGRHGDAAALQVDDQELIRRVLDDLAALAGVTAKPIDAVVMRWGGGLPQYAVGHVERVDTIEAEVAGLPGLAVAGAALHGVGVAACIGTAEAAARHVMEHVRAGDGSIGAWRG
ncbi:MAG TPA: protoporphyrinogen oxidase [Pseudonocardiaceae bacterium]|nr:protoporphyrinogen oxidase [Pseudonocardiaceae bacterium]